MDNQQLEDNLFDVYGYRYNVGIIISNKMGQVFWGKRKGQDSWQFPQGGINAGESSEQALWRELFEETGLRPDQVRMLGKTRHWLKYRLPMHYRRKRKAGMIYCVGQRQQWYLLRLHAEESAISLTRSRAQEFDDWCWIDCWKAPSRVIHFKRNVYQQALEELAPLLHLTPSPTGKVPSFARREKK